MKKSSFLTGLLIFSSIALLGNQSDELFRKGNEAFQQKNYEAAAMHYEQVMESGFNSPELEYNLGNAYFRMGNTGKAILHYERAMVMSPNDGDVKHNLGVARQQVKGEIEALPEFFLSRWWKLIRNAAGSGVWGILALVLWWAGAAGLILWQTGRTRKQRKAGFLAGLSCLLISLLPFSLALSRVKYESKTNYAIVLEPTAVLRSAPDDSGSDILNLYEGTKVKLQDELGGWWQVKLANGETGWLKSSDAEEI